MLKCPGPEHEKHELLLVAGVVAGAVRGLAAAGPGGPVPAQPDGQRADRDAEGVRILPRIQVTNLRMDLRLILVLETKVIRMFPKISQSRRRPLLGPSPG